MSKLSGTPSSQTILLVGKPWRGGLARYVRAALDALFPGQVVWLPTYPETAKDARLYRKDRKAWREALLRRIEQAQYAAALFINHPDGLDGLPARPNHVLWLTDDPRQPPDAYTPYARVHVSDPGYGSELRSILGERYGGVVPFAHCRHTHRFVGASRQRGACMVANRDPKRDLHLDALFRAGMAPLTVGNYFARHRLFWRAPWRFRPRVANSAMGDIYARHAVSLNVHAEVVREGTNMRTFECAAYGIAQLVEYRPGLEELFTLDDELAIYHEAAELPDAMAALLSDAPRQIQMAERARERVSAAHCYEHRVAALLTGVLQAPALKRWQRD